MTPHSNRQRILHIFGLALSIYFQSLNRITSDSTYDTQTMLFRLQKHFNCSHSHISLKPKSSLICHCLPRRAFFWSSLNDKEKSRLHGVMNPQSCKKKLLLQPKFSLLMTRCKHILVIYEKKIFKERSFDFIKCSHKDEIQIPLPDLLKKFPYSPSFQRRRCRRRR